MKIKIYVAHPISGIPPSQESLEKNIRKAIEFNETLTATYPNIQWYVPGAHDEFPQVALYNGLLKLEDILHIDKLILSTCDGLLAYEWAGSYGLVGELEYATRLGLPIFRFRVMPTLSEIDDFLNLVMDRKTEEGLRDTKGSV